MKQPTFFVGLFCAVFLSFLAVVIKQVIPYSA